MPRLHLYHACLFVAAFSAVSGSAWAQQREPRYWPTRGGFDGDSTGRDMAARAVRRAQAESGGRVLGAERVQADGRDIMRVKVMDGTGRVRYMDDDPAADRPSQNIGDEQNEIPGERPRGPNPQRP